MKAPALLVLFACACASPALQPSTRLTAPAPQPSTRLTAPAPRDAGAEVRASLAFLDEGFEPPPLRVTRVRDGVVRASADGEPINEPSNRSMVWHYPVLEPDHEGTSARPRIFCELAGVRVALHLDAESLATVALDGAVLRLDDAPRAGGDRQPGVYFTPGASLEVVGRDEGIVRVRFHGFLLEAAGIVDAAHVGNVFEEIEPRDEGWNAELPEGATFLDAPRGRTIAVLEPYPSRAQRHVATILAPAREGYVLVRFAGHNATVVGWVEASRVVSVGEQRGERGIGIGGGGGGLDRFVRPIALPAGTRLLDGPSGATIGILSQARTVECLDACEDGSARVEIDSCVGTVRLWTAPPAP